MKIEKPLGGKAYGSIGHLPGSRLGPSDSSVPEGQAEICTSKTRDKHDKVIVEEKLDGSCCCVAMIKGKIVPLTRAGYPAYSSPYEQHWLFGAWVADHERLFRKILHEGWRVCGEWMAQAHGTLYADLDGPFYAFDLIGPEWQSATRSALAWETITCVLPVPECVSIGPVSPVKGLDLLGKKHAEGLVYRVERHGKVDFLAKYVRHDKIDGRYLPEVTGGFPVWNWGPKASLW